MSQGELSTELSLALRSIDGLPGVVLLGAPRRSPAGTDAWVFDVDLTPGGLGDRYRVPKTTRWVVGVSDDYPYGGIDIMPARSHGLTVTFPHQLANDDGPHWRHGKVCVGLHDGVLGRLAKVDETYVPEERLRWHIERAMAWLRAASRDELAQAGDPFELPDFNPSDQSFVAFSETTESFERWNDPDVPVAGLVDLRSVRSRDRFGFPKRFVAAFSDARGREIAATPWGTYFPDATVMPRGFWLRLPQIAVVEPYGRIQTWGQLREVCEMAGIDLDTALAPVLDDLRPHEGRRWRKKARKFASTRVGLIGMPIPSVAGGPPVQMHWQGLMLPGLSAAGSPAMKGFRPTRRNLRAIDRREVTGTNHAINWMRSENWGIDQIAARGILEKGARDARIALIGAGTVGSLAAEALVRLGVRDVTIMDPERLHGGNLVRHTLTLEDAEEFKATQLADRLAAAHPAVRVTSFRATFPSLSDEARAALDRCDAVLETTGADDVIRALARYPWATERVFVSISIAADGERLFAFANRGDRLDEEAFFGWFNPLAEAERLRTGPLPIEGAGCWHPVMPARWDRIMALVGLVTPWVEARLARPPAAPVMTSIDLPRVA